MAAVDDVLVEKVAIPGPTLTSILQRVSTCHGDFDGLLFGQLICHASVTLTDDHGDAASSHPNITAIVTSHISFDSVLSFYDSLGHLNLSAVARSQPTAATPLIGWFVSRRRTALRPSMREVSVSASLLRTLNSSNSTTVDRSHPLIFLLFSSPMVSSKSVPLVHTYEYRAFQFCWTGPAFEPKSVEIINIGPAFHGHYSSFVPISPIPWQPCRFAGTGELCQRESLSRRKQLSNEQKILDSCTSGYEVEGLANLINAEATSEMEALYRSMLAKLEGLARSVEKSSARVLEQEHWNIKLRAKVAGLD